MDLADAGGLSFLFSFSAAAATAVLAETTAAAVKTTAHPAADFFYLPLRMTT